MELTLNLSWLVITCLLFAGVGVAHRRGQLNLSLKLALGCAAVLALLLFPVISMTDDLQQAQALSEWPAGHSAGLPSSSIEASTVAFACTMILLLLLLLATANVLLARLLDERKTVESRGRQQPYAVRPPPSLALLLVA